jgi:hypothetical protein
MVFHVAEARKMHKLSWVLYPPVSGELSNHTWNIVVVTSSIQSYQLIVVDSIKIVSNDLSNMVQWCDLICGHKLGCLKTWNLTTPLQASWSLTSMSVKKPAHSLFWDLSGKLVNPKNKPYLGYVVPSLPAWEGGVVKTIPTRMFDVSSFMKHVHSRTPQLYKL